MTTLPIAQHVREHRSILAGPEKQALRYLAEHMPRRIHSDHLTILGLASMLLAGLSYVAARWRPEALVLVVACLALNWLGDSLDGTLARVRNQQRPRYGFYVDHVCDIVGTVFLVGGLSLSGYMSPTVALLLLAAFLSVKGEVFLATSVRGVFRLSSLGFGPTELRVVLAFGTLYLLHKPVVRIGGAGPFLLFDVGGVVAIAGLGLAFLVSAARTTIELYRAEPRNR